MSNIYRLKPSTAQTYLDYQRWSQSKAGSSAVVSPADIFLVKAVVERIEGGELTDAEAIELLIGDAAGESGELLQSVFDVSSLIQFQGDAFGDSREFSVGSVRIARKPIPWSALMKIKGQLTGDSVATLESVVTEYYLCDDKPITSEGLTAPYPEGLGFSAMAGIASHFLALLGKFQATQI